MTIAPTQLQVHIISIEIRLNIKLQDSPTGGFIISSFDVIDELNQRHCHKALTLRGDVHHDGNGVAAKECKHRDPCASTGCWVSL